MDVYIRTREGDTFEAPLREGIRQFLSDNGYRITFYIEDPTTIKPIELVLRKDTVVNEEIRENDELLGFFSVNAALTIKNLKP